jgi:glycosyltransferase involved in cell wall biosynthesis
MLLRQLVHADCARGGCDGHDIVFYAPEVGETLKGKEFFPQGGAENQVVMLARALVRNGHRVAIVVSGRAEDLPGEVDGVTISVRKPPARGRGVAGKLVEASRIWRSLAKAPSQWIVVRGATVDLGIIGVYARVARRRLVFASANVSDFEHRRLQPNRLYLILYMLGVRLSRLIVVQTEEQAELCRKVFRRPVRVIRSISRPAPAQDAVPVAFLWVGRLVAYKRPLEYMALARAVPEARFWMVGVPIPHLAGDQMLMEAVLTQARSLPNLELLTPRPHAQLQHLMARAVASVNTAAFEGMSNVLLEGWSMGVPALVLSYDPDGVLDKYGLGAFAAGEADKFVESARGLWRSRHDRVDVSRRCREYIAAHHAPELIVHQWSALLESGRPHGGIREHR